MSINSWEGYAQIEPETPVDHRIVLREALAASITTILDAVGHEPTAHHLRTFLRTDPDVTALRNEVREIRSFLRVEAPQRAAETIEALDAVLSSTRRPLACPDCGQPVEVNMGTEGRPYMTYEVVDGFECSDFRCGSEWTKAGAVLRYGPRPA